MIKTKKILPRTVFYLPFLKKLKVVFKNSIYLIPISEVVCLRKKGLGMLEIFTIDDMLNSRSSSFQVDSSMIRVVENLQSRPELNFLQTRKGVLINGNYLSQIYDSEGSQFLYQKITQGSDSTELEYYVVTSFWPKIAKNLRLKDRTLPEKGD
jgi:hypothetical protein